MDGGGQVGHETGAGGDDIVVEGGVGLERVELLIGGVLQLGDHLVFEVVGLVLV